MFESGTLGVQFDAEVFEIGKEAGVIADLASQAGIKERIDSLKPEETVISERYGKFIVKVQLKGITLGQLTKYLYSIESSPYSLEVRRLHIAPKKGLLDVTFEVSTLLSRAK